MNSKRTKVSIIGAGFVGSSIAYSLMMSNLVSELVIVDINRDKAEGEAMDLSHGSAFVKPIDIVSGDYSSTEDSDIVIITAGVNRKPGESRLDLINKNLNIFKSIVPEVVKYSPQAILLVVSNPMDILTYITYKLSGFPKERVIGSGTVLDTSRLRYLLGKHFCVDVRNIHAYIMGEHGDSEIVAWSTASVAGMDIDSFCGTTCKECDDSFKNDIYDEVKNAGKKVIEKKGATYYAIGLAVRRIVECILRDENSILTVSTLLSGEYGIDNVYMGIPTIVGRDGVKRVLEVKLNEDEKLKLKTSSDTLKELISGIEI
ncbi:L-lactate dehydrogenase [Clostridium sp. YIM B02515]|uniref:L-lactate dehydrogenase n=1 Tax=Clostridium rhizosphaerae TaxID=2803861 RepID=A0ABS1T914_9CLOT|nr:L-lactate dehydrogenase [Clostridium rhizosphaerae]MBL4935836.1 L-lactate dehydrogenase [Clostridium rhizosphaerae]